MYRVLFSLLIGAVFTALTACADTVWYDSARNRAIPVRITFPNTTEKSPVILFSHGIGGSIDCCSYLAKEWSRNGFVCVFIQHPGSDENIWKGKIRILSEFKESFKHNWSSRTRAEDLRFALDCLGEIAATNKPFAERVDLTRVGVGGYDLGALAAMLVAGQVPPDGGESLKDNRVKAVLAMSPPVRWTNMTFEEIYQPVHSPTLFITGTKDDGIIGPTKAEHRRIPFDAMHGNRYLITLKDGDHRIYGGRIFTLLARNDEKFQAAIVRSSTVFWYASLKHNTDAVQAMNVSGWQHLVGIQASIERSTELNVGQQPQPLVLQ
jgi:predicted dienelactone hydrolase